ncbi:MAG: glycerate kinase [Anaerolineales bacterium]|nr:glycerate kinase [Anaerolineales bacterium]
MKETFEPRQAAWQIIHHALEAVDPAKAVNNYFDAHPDVVDYIKSTPGRLFVVGAGKAGTPMAAAASQRFGSKIAAGQMIVKYDHTSGQADVLDQIAISEAGHPVPDQAGFLAAQAMAHLLDQTREDDVVLCLISGGGSALLTLPAEGLSLTDLQETTQALLAAGATINEINTIRKHLSAVKGGGLARLAAPAQVYALILSDVVGDPLEIIASGPTVPDPSTFADTWAIVAQYNLETTLPEPVIRRLQAGLTGAIPDTPDQHDPLFNRVTNAIIGSNRIAARAAVAAAQIAGFNAQLLTTFVEGEAREVARVMAGLAKGLAKDEGIARPACLVLGGETTVTLRGNGQGGRNQEMALAAAIALHGWDNTLIVCLGTDGTDGPTDAAGAFAFGVTIAKAEKLGLEAVDFLHRNDAYNFFSALDDLIITGPTNTNVNDLTFILVW